MKMKDFAKYIQYKSFDEELHKIRQKSFERIIASETLLEKELSKSKKAHSKKTA